MMKLSGAQLQGFQQTLHILLQPKEIHLETCAKWLLFEILFCTDIYLWQTEDGLRSQLMRFANHCLWFSISIE